MTTERGYGKTMVCETCLFWGMDKLDPALGKCRYNAPTVIQTEDGHFDGEWPETWSDDWCGRWMPAAHVQPWQKSEVPS